MVVWKAVWQKEMTDLDSELSLPEIQATPQKEDTGDCLALPVVAETRAPGETVLDSYLAQPQPCVRLTPKLQVPGAQQRGLQPERSEEGGGAEPCGAKSQVWTSDSRSVHRPSTAARGMPRRCRGCVSRGETLLHGPAWGPCWAQSVEKSRCGAHTELTRRMEKAGFVAAICLCSQLCCVWLVRS